MKQDIDRLVAWIAPDPGPGMTEGACELLGEITAMPRAARTTRRKWRFAIPLTAVLAAAAVAAGWLLPGRLGLGPGSASALDIRQEGGYYVVTVKQLFADPKQYQAELHVRGLDITLTVEPVSPSMEGVMVPFDKRSVGLSEKQIAQRNDLIAPIERPGACAETPRCTIGLKVPVDYRGKAVVVLGRKARPGERFRAFGQLNNPDEPLQCRRFVNRTVDQVRSMLAAHHVTVGTFAVPLKGFRSGVPGSWYVHEGWLTEPGKALLVAAPTRNPTPWPLAPRCADHS